MQNTDSAPEDIAVSEHVFDIAFHPHRDIVAAGLINGIVEVYEYTLWREKGIWKILIYDDILDLNMQKKKVNEHWN